MNQPELVIKEAGLTDLATITHNRIAYLNELLGQGDAARIGQLTRELNDYFREEMAAGRFFALIAEHDGQAVAFGAMVIKRIPGDFNQSSYLEGDILNMYTIPSQRRKGISSLILKALLKKAQAMGISKVALHTSIDGEALYRKFGFNDPVYPVLERTIDPLPVQ